MPGPIMPGGDDASGAARTGRRRPRRRGRWLVLGAVLLAGGVTAAALSPLDRPTSIWSRTQVPVARGPAEVVVYGGSAPSLAAAVTAARDGEKTLLLAPDRLIGGVITQGWLTTWDLSRAPNNSLLDGGIFAHWFRVLGGHDSFALSAAQKMFTQLAMHTPNLTTRTGVRIDRVTVRNGRIETIRYQVGSRVHIVPPAVVIDGSGNADLAGQAGARFVVGFSQAGLGHATQADTLIFRLGGVNWTQVIRSVRPWDFTALHQLVGTLPHSAWGFSYLDRPFKSDPPNIRLRGLNLAHEPDGTVLVSGLWVFGVDPTSPASLHAGLLRARRALPWVVGILRRKVPGMAHARLLGSAPELYVRESRQVVTQQTLTVNDALDNVVPAQTIALGNYPVDVQATAPYGTGAVVGHPAVYGVPLGALLPEGFSNLMVVNRSAGYTAVAAGSARTLPVGISEGQAAGDAAQVAISRHIPVASLTRDRAAFLALRRLLLAQGAILRPTFPVPAPPSVPAWAMAAFRSLRAHLLIYGGYNNNYGLSTTVTWPQFAALLEDVRRVYDGASSLMLPRAVPMGPIPAADALKVVGVNCLGQPTTAMGTLVRRCGLPRGLARAWNPGGDLTQLQAVAIAYAVARMPTVTTTNLSAWMPYATTTPAG